MDKLIGKRIAGRYNIQELIGMGGMAAVYSAECEMLKRKVAVKVLLENLRGDTETVNSFTKEAQAAARLSHNNIVSVYDVGEDDGLNYMVMECVEGVTLKQYIEENGPFSWQEACDFCLQIGAALSEAHAHDVIHRDIKPQNILITKDKILKVTDFGIAKAAGTNTVTMGNASAIGTVHYISPEQARGGYTDERSDIYSLGVVLYELLTGKVPFDGDTAIAVALMHIEKPVPDILKENPSLPRGMRKIIETAMAKEQFARYSTVEEFMADLRAVLAGEEVNENTQEEDLGATRVRKFDEEEFERERKRRALEADTEDYDEIEDDEDEQPKKKKRVKTEEEKKADKRATILAFLTIILLFVIGFGVYSLLLKNSGQIRVPNLVLMTLEEANTQMTEMGLKLSEEVEYSLSDEVEEGKIISQNPEAGEIIKSSEEVTVVVSIGSSGGSIAVPQVVGETAEGAIELLLDSELSYEIKDEASDKVAAGKVIRQNPIAGTKVNADEIVTIVLSTGKAEEVKKEDISVPKVKGYSLSDARDILEANSLRLGTVSTKASDLPQGTVISQSPVSGNLAAADSTVNLVISAGESEDATQEPQNTVTKKPEEEEPTTASGSTKRYSLPIPDPNETGEEVTVRILVAGEPVYEKTHKRGETATVEITEVGSKKIEAYVDDVLVNSQVVNFG